MTEPTPPPSPDDGKQLPARHRPSIGTLSQDTTELDLWAFDDDLDSAHDPSQDAPRGVSAAIPSPRDQRPTKKKDASEENVPAGESGESIRMDVSRSRAERKPSPPLATPTPEGEFDDLEIWDDAPKGAVIGELPDETIPVRLSPTPDAEVKKAETKKVEEPSPVSPQAATTADDDEFAPKARKDIAPASMRPHLRLSTIERTGMIALGVMLLAVGVFAYFHTINKLPSASMSMTSREFPIKGSMITVESASSYWREPVLEGPNADTIRRDTKLLPVLVLKITEGKGAVRVIFRDAEDKPIGDALTLPVRGAGVLEIPATAGFTDIGMYAAYRTDSSQPWTIEIFEAASEAATGDEIKLLFDMKVSSDRR